MCIRDSSWKSQPFVSFSFSTILLQSFCLSFAHSFPVSYRSSSTSSLHLSVGLPFILFCEGFHSGVLFTILLSSIRATCPVHAIHSDLIYFTMSASPVTCQFSRILHVPSTFYYWTMCLS